MKRFKLCLMIDLTKLYILVQEHMTLTLIQGHRDARKLKLLHKLFHKVVNRFKVNFASCLDLLV